MFRHIVKIGLILGVGVNSVSALELSLSKVVFDVMKNSKCIDVQNDTKVIFGHFKAVKNLSCEKIDNKLRYIANVDLNKEYFEDVQTIYEIVGAVSEEINFPTYKIINDRICSKTQNGYGCLAHFDNFSMEVLVANTHKEMKVTYRQK